MARYGTLGDYRFADTEDAANDIRGAKLYGLQDKKLGEIDDVIFDETTGAIVYLVIDTGGWLSTKRFIVPPSEIRPSLEHPDDFRVDLTQEQIESFPPYDGESLTSEEQWADYEKRYRSKWVEKPVMHREETDRNITPTTKQQIDAGSGRIPSRDAAAVDLDAATKVAPTRTEAAMDLQPGGPTLKWTTFEETLRRRREEVLQSSIDNAKRASGEKSLERRKAS
jgi:sporulation protein YlmC with PRC-barrel domain